MDLTGDPDGLAAALARLDRLQGDDWERLAGRNGPRWLRLFRTHPTIAERIERLRHMRRSVPCRCPSASAGRRCRGATPGRGGQALVDVGGERKPRRAALPPLAQVLFAHQPVHGAKRQHGGAEGEHLHRLGLLEVEQDELAHHREQRDQHHHPHLHHVEAPFRRYQQRALELQRDHHGKDRPEHYLEHRRIGGVEQIGEHERENDAEQQVPQRRDDDDGDDPG